MKCKIDKDKTIELVERGVSQADIAKFNDCSPQAVCQFLQRYEIEKSGLDDFEKNHTQIYTALMKVSTEKRLEILKEINVSSMTPNEKQRWYHSLAVTGGVDFDKQRLLKGESTHNISFQQITTELADLETEEARLQEELAGI